MVRIRFGSAAAHTVGCILLNIIKYLRRGQLPGVKCLMQLTYVWIDIKSRGRQANGLHEQKPTNGIELHTVAIRHPLLSQYKKLPLQSLIILADGAKRPLCCNVNAHKPTHISRFRYLHTIHPPTHPPAHPLTHLLTHSLTHPLIHSLPSLHLWGTKSSQGT